MAFSVGQGLQRYHGSVRHAFCREEVIEHDQPLLEQVLIGRYGSERVSTA